MFVVLEEQTTRLNQVANKALEQIAKKAGLQQAAQGPSENDALLNSNF